MFLKIESNPHQSGRMTRTLRYEPAPGQVYAIDAETLHKQPRLLSCFRRSATWQVRAVDAVAYGFLVASVIASFFVAAWMFVPGVAACALALMVNRSSAGRIARRAAGRSYEDFRRLHEMGVLWLVRD